MTRKLTYFIFLFFSMPTKVHKVSKTPHFVDYRLHTDFPRKTVLELKAMIKSYKRLQIIKCPNNRSKKITGLTQADKFNIVKKVDTFSGSFWITLQLGYPLFSKHFATLWYQSIKVPQRPWYDFGWRSGLKFFFFFFLQTFNAPNASASVKLLNAVGIISFSFLSHYKHGKQMLS